MTEGVKIVELKSNWKTAAVKMIRKIDRDACETVLDFGTNFLAFLLAAFRYYTTFLWGKVLDKPIFEEQSEHIHNEQLPTCKLFNIIRI